jgi:glucosamine kinase
MGLFLGVDAGGTQTTAAVGTGVRILGRGSAGSCKLPQVSREHARRELHAAITEACRQAQVEPAQVESACIGMAGVSNREAAEAVLALAGEMVPAPCEAVADSLIVLEAAFRGGPGVVVIAGTGSMALGRNEAGETARAGGLGPAVSDQGSGYWIGKQAVEAALRALETAHAEDSGAALAQRLLRHWRVDTPVALARAAGQASPAEMARLFPEVTAAAAAGDRAAQAILLRAGRELAALALDVIRRLWPPPPAAQVAVSGGVLRNSSVVRQAMEGAIQEAHPSAVSLYLAQQAAQRAQA